MLIRTVALVTIGFGVGFTNAAAQNANDIFRLFGGVMQTAIIQATVDQWRKIPESEVVCVDQELLQRGSSLRALINQGITPSDPRVAGSRSACRNQVVQQPNQPIQSVKLPSVYIVDGLALGGPVKIDSEAYRSYACAPSEQFAGFTWCQKKVEERVARGQFTSSYSILHSQAGAALYVNRYLEPAWFSANEANDDINARSKRYGAPSRIIPMPRQSSIPNGMIATWGSVVLEPLDPNSLKQLAVGRDVHVGFMIDHIGNFQRSAQQGLPIYRLIGGAGYVWAASWNQVGVGTLRFLAIDASAIAAQISAPSANILADTLKPPPPSAPAISPADEAASVVASIKSALIKISDRSASLRNSDNRKRVEEIAARLATANPETPLTELKVLKGEADHAVRIFAEDDDFGRVSEIANKRVAEINAVLDKITSDAPLIQKLQMAIKELRDEQNGSNIGSLQSALRKLNKLFDENRVELKSLGFESP
jgi:hypothetical protein